jgi:2-C-methyl-D-erythritol 4-phosphate cytidylyltransferase
MGMSLFRKKEKPAFLSAVIVAAGSGSRMEGVDKQRAVIGEIPGVVRSIAMFEACPRVQEIVVVCRPEHIAAYFDLVRDFGLAKVVSVVEGGKERQDSVFRGVEACSPDAQYYAIHDGARPLVTEEEILRCIDAAVKHGAATVATTVKDTIKLCGEDGFIRSTLNRAELRSVATPQIFEAQLYREAMKQARESHCLYTDDCQLVERIGRRVFLSPGSYENIKITTPEDLALAEAILAYREGGVLPWQPYE